MAGKKAFLTSFENFRSSMSLPCPPYTVAHGPFRVVQDIPLYYRPSPGLSSSQPNGARWTWNGETRNQRHKNASSGVQSISRWDKQ